MAKMAHSTDINTAASQAIRMYEAVIKQLEEAQKQSKLK
jgi:hypothetical protein